eukprot:6171847-Pleurochrysis_carterae.AAC.2
MRVGVFEAACACWSECKRAEPIEENYAPAHALLTPCSRHLGRRDIMVQPLSPKTIPTMGNRARLTFCVCSASSRVGESASACVSLCDVSRHCRTPAQKIVVLPVPDCA